LIDRTAQGITNHFSKVKPDHSLLLTGEEIIGLPFRLYDDAAKKPEMPSIRTSNRNQMVAPWPFVAKEAEPRYVSLLKWLSRQR
jgi:hypothetical protein